MKRVENRIFSLDCARKYYTPAWIKKLITLLSEEGYTAITMHFSEDMGMRLESKLYPWLAGGDHTLCVYGSANGQAENNGKFITQDEMADIVRFANEKGLEVIPSLDSPGHMNYVVKKYNEHFNTDIGNYFHKDGKVSIVQGTSHTSETTQKLYSRGIDIANPEAIAFVKSLYTEYGRFFYELGCRKFDIGGDELLGFGETIDDSLSKWRNLDHWDELAIKKTGNRDAVAYDAFILYANEISELVRSLGYETVLMWNDDVYRDFDTAWKGVAVLDPRIEIMYWSPLANGGKNPPSVYLEKGHSIYNFISRYTYYVVGVGLLEGTTIEIERDWDAYTFDIKDPQNKLPSPNEKIKGGGFCLWSDCPGGETEDELFEHLTPLIKLCAKKLLGK